MANSLYIRLPRDPERPAQWLVREGATTLRSGFGLAEAARQGAMRTVVLVPGSEVLLTQVQLPAGPRQRLLQAVPYALEDQLAQEVEDLHFAIGRREADGSVPVAVVARALMTHWLGQLAEAGLQPVRLLPETLALPWAAGSWCLLVGPDLALLRTGAESGYAFEPELLEAALPHALGRESRPARLRVYDCRPAADRDDLVERACAAAGVELDRPPCDTPLALLATGAADIGLDLLQGPFSRREQLGRRWRPWLPAAALAGALLLLQGGVTVADYFRLAREERQLGARIEQLYRTTFPEAKKVVDPKVQMEQQLAQLRGGPGKQELADLVTRAGPVLAQAPGLNLKGLRYREGEMEIDIVLADLAGLDRLKQNLAGDARLDTDIQNANARGSTVEARLVLRRRAGT